MVEEVAERTPVEIDVLANKLLVDIFVVNKFDIVALVVTNVPILAIILPPLTFPANLNVPVELRIILPPVIIDSIIDILELLEVILPAKVKLFELKLVI